MHYRMRDHLSACVVGDQVLFLDIDADRYFRLPEDLERTFLAYERAPDNASAASMLVASSILVPAVVGGDAAPTHLDAPLRSVLEMAEGAAGCGISAIPEVVATLLACRRALGTRRFRVVLESAAKNRDRRCQPLPGMPDTEAERALLRATHLFLRARPYVPIEPCCLPDSLALTRFLARRGLHSRMVFGVTCEPFSAHCWLQAGDIALNETVGYARAHTVIRVV
ncbi:MAG: lasso peptide biosynthesis B2 protein [Pseudomonadota bacterium]|nr:lasso peptide biosynthesis B2 protein [Pseudomonadota bacterium]